LEGTNLNGTTYASNANYPKFTSNIDMATITLPTPGGNFRLLDNSPVIDKGDVAYTKSIFSDLDGEARVQNGGLDLGPYEGGIICTAPVIKTQPVARTKFEGQSATFDCGATGTGLTYQWRKDGINISGATSASYTKTELVKADAGSYTCLVTGTCGEATSDAAMLTVNAACVNPVITVQPLGATKKVFESVTFTVEATGSNLKYSWSQGLTATRISKATDASYTIKSVGMQHAGTYYCYVTNECNETVTSGAVLVVNKADQTIRFNTLATRTYGDADFWPDVIASAVPITLVSSNTNVATIVNNLIHIVGVGTSTITSSQAGDVNFNAATDVSQVLTVVKGTAALTLSNLVQAYDGSAKSVTVTSEPSGLTTIGVTYDGSATVPSAIGSYAVVATLTNANYEGTVSGTLQITCKPVVADALQGDYYITEGQPFTITVNAVGTPTLVYQWKKGSTNIGTNSATFTIDIVSTSDIGDYTCNISNACGDITTNAATLHVQLAVPLAATATPATIFTGSSSDLSAISTGNQIRWYNAPVEGTLLGTSESGANFSVTPAENTTWYAEAFNSGTNITPSATRAPVTVNVVPPNAIVINNYQTFGGSIGTDLVSKYGQAFTTDNKPRILKSAEFSLWTDGAGGGNAVVQLYSSNPDGTIKVLVSTLEGCYVRTVNNESANPSEIWSFAPPTPVTLSASTTYWFVIYSNFEAGTDQCDFDFTASTDYNGLGTMPVTKNTSSWDVGTSSWAYFTLADNPFKFAVYADLIGNSLWTGATDTDWNKAGNWSDIKVPGSSDNATIPFTGITNFPVVLAGNLAVCNNLTIASGAFVTISPTGMMDVSGDIANNTGVAGMIVQATSAGTGSLYVAGTTIGSGTVETYMSVNNWHLVSAPADQKIIDFLGYNLNIPKRLGVVPTTYGLTDYNISTNVWNPYFTDAIVGNSYLGVGKGYLLLTYDDNGVVDDNNRRITYKGLLNTGKIDVPVTAGAWNLVGNPFTTAIKLNNQAVAEMGSGSNFVAYNLGAMDNSFTCAYFWNDGIKGYDVSNLADSGAGFVPVGQGFFMKVATGKSTVTFTPRMQGHKGTATFKSGSAPYPEIRLMVANGDKNATAKIKFIEGTTNGLDIGYDAGVFKSDPSFVVYTRLVNNNGVEFQLQCLPPTGYDKVVIPIGIDSKAGGEIVFSVETVNLEAGCKAILEDKLTNTFTDLSIGNHKAVVAANTIGTGRFYLHTGDIVSGLEDQENAEGKLTAYANGNKEIRVIGEVGEGAVATLVNGLGQVVLTNKLGAGSLNIIGLPNLSSGVYMLNINDKGTPQTIKVMVRK
jgi:hypothetical protein